MYLEAGEQKPNNIVTHTGNWRNGLVFQRHDSVDAGGVDTAAGRLKDDSKLVFSVLNIFNINLLKVLFLLGYNI